ncbi:unnamed protein product, partial [Mesorhabditis belari]|uniref:SGF29 C-terminal domain-containing protein n=1 Tax=Mesorhabditis belari TaxID=2138241 RepID=A0AAF3EV30_9BILA
MSRTTSKKTEEELLDEQKQAVTRDLIKKFRNYLTKKEKTNDTLMALQQKQKDGVYNRKNKSQILPMLSDAQKACEVELETFRKLLGDIEKIRQKENTQRMEGLVRRHTLMSVLNNQASALPLYIDIHSSYPSSGVGGIPYADSHNFKKGDYVAAYIEDNWILAEVENSVPGGKFGVKDIEDESHKVQHVVRRRLIGLPSHRADPLRDGHALFPADAIVLALYPQTTCFYKGAVVTSPKVATEDYTVAFEDSSYAGGYSPPLPVAQRYVLCYREIKKAAGNKRKCDED